MVDLTGIGEPEPKEHADKHQLEIPTAAERKRREIKARRQTRIARGGEPDLGQKRGEGGVVARKLIHDKVYQRKLQKRLRDGTAGQIEVYLWRLAHGEPPKNEDDQAAANERYERMRTHVMELLRHAPELATALDARVQRAPRILPAPRLPPPEPPDGSQPS